MRAQLGGRGKRSRRMSRADWCARTSRLRLRWEWIGLSITLAPRASEFCRFAGHVTVTCRHSLELALCARQVIPVPGITALLGERGPSALSEEKVPDRAKIKTETPMRDEGGKENEALRWPGSDASACVCVFAPCSRACKFPHGHDLHCTLLVIPEISRPLSRAAVPLYVFSLETSHLAIIILPAEGRITSEFSTRPNL